MEVMLVGKAEVLRNIVFDEIQLTFDDSVKSLGYIGSRTISGKAS